MSNHSVAQLPADTVKLITSSQIVTSVCTTVKELLENSIDAGGTIIQVRLENYGLDLIEVKDNGFGVSYDNVQKMFLPGYTSKIKHFEDLNKLYSYGFRGEALAAICKIGKVTITTKTNSDALAMTYEIDSNGVPQSSKPNHLNIGTIITVRDIFANLPVRRLYMSAKKKINEELKKTERIIQSLSVVHPELNVSFTHNKCLVWKKNSVKGLKQSLMQAITLKTVSKMDHINKLFNDIEIDLIVPKKTLDDVNDVFSNAVNSLYVYVNKRPVTCKILAQPVQEHIFHNFRQINHTYKHAICLVSLSVPPQVVDINIEPNKTKVLLKNHTDVIKFLDEILIGYYGHTNFHCTAVKETMMEEEDSVHCFDASTIIDDSVSEEPDEVRITKKPRLQEKSTKTLESEKTIDRFIERHKNWNVEIINESPVVSSNVPSEESTSSENDKGESSSLCSQINKENCVLTTADEVNQLNTMLSETHHSVISTNSKNSVTRLVERNELQVQPPETRILPEWPIRNTVNVPAANSNPKGSFPDDENVSSQNLLAEPKTVEEIAAEIENDVDRWTSDLNKAMKPESNKTLDADIDEGEVANFNLSVESISSQMGKKEMKAFTKFARIMRPKIIAEFPKLIFTQVAALLAERWKALSPADVKYYEKMAEVVDLNRKKCTEVKQFVKEEPDKGQCKQSTEKNLKTLLDQIKRKNKLNRPPRKEVTLVTSMSRIRNLVNGSDTHKAGENILESDDFHIAGQLQPSGNWLYIRGKEIGHVSHNGLQEVITYRKLLSSHEVERKCLSEPIAFTETSLGVVPWTVLISLDFEYSPKTSRYVVTSDVVGKNGFRIEMDQVGDVHTSGYITEVAAFIPQFGIADLISALELYLSNGEVGGLASWRPTSVRSYLTNEAVRRHQSNSAVDQTEMEDLLNTFNLCLKHEGSNCLHHKPIFVPIHHIQE